MSAAGFLAAHWQKTPLHLPGALDGVFPALSGEELAWLATQDDVESRLVYTEHHANGTRYRVENGPFDDELLSTLPDRDWTLLVQDVEKHLPDFRQLFSMVSFIPDWRIDDLMISFAAPGGSVGPHQDNYDVFLCQGSGHREWRLADPDRVTPAVAGQLRLLEPFTDDAAVSQKEGDVLYLPPAIPHWGIALDASMTYSVGMRAPTLAELRCSFEREFPQAGNPFADYPGDNNIFYTDRDLDGEESSAGRISPSSIKRCRQLLRNSVAVSDAALATTLGCVVTDLKAWMVPETPSDKELADLQQLFSTDKRLNVHGMARIAWWFDHKQLLVFANGHCQAAVAENLTFIRTLCTQRKLPSLPPQDTENHGLFVWLIKIGVFDLETIVI